MKQSWTTVPIPQLMQDNCEIDPRGLPVPYVVLKDNQGKHHFKINDTKKTYKCLTDSLCSICGTHLSIPDRWMVGGIASAFDKGGYYVDHPIHKECGEYALKVCPYLAVKGYNGKIDMVKLAAQVSGNIQLNNPTVDQDRLPFFVFLKPLQVMYFQDRNDPNDIKVKALGPYHSIEYWDEGEQITDIEIVRQRLLGTKWEKYLPAIIQYEEDFASRKTFKTPAFLKHQQ